jgi:DNA-binding PadR family transcriptional regulator
VSRATGAARALAAPTPAQTDERLRASLLVAVAASPATAGRLVERLGRAGGGPFDAPAARRALRSLVRDGLVSRCGVGDGHRRTYRLSPLGEERFRRFAELLDAGPGRFSPLTKGLPCSNRKHP